MHKKLESFKPINKKLIGVYVCGPTVYGPSHLGHARTYISFDTIRRYLEYRGYDVKFICNITDIHDDIIREANKLNISIYELSDRYIPKFLKDMETLNVEPASVYPRVTAHITEIINAIKELLEKGYAYQAQDGSVYYDISKFSSYGRLSGIKINANKTGTRITTDKYDKDQVEDFVLWKSWRKGEHFWESPWGKGRPGWHIECSVMSQKYLGDTIDIHGGALDLLFPHHENEIAQSEGITGKTFVKYWMHSGLLKIEGEKMSKSLGNYLEIPDLLKKYDPKVLRFFFLSSHYRSSIDFKESSLDAIENSMSKIKNIFAGQNFKESGEKPNIKYTKLFCEAMDEDFNTPKAIAVMWDMLKSSISPMKKYETLLDFDRVLGINFQQLIANTGKLSDKAEELLQKREKVREQHNWQEADLIREELSNLKVEVRDTPKGQIWKKTN